MKFSWIALVLQLAGGIAAAGIVTAGCGPEEKFCPDANGRCPPPLPPPVQDAGPTDTGSTTDMRSERRRN